VRDALLVTLLVALRVGVAVREPEAEHDADTLTEGDGDELTLEVADRELEGERDAVAVALAVALIEALALAVMDGLCTDGGTGRACEGVGNRKQLADMIPASPPAPQISTTPQQAPCLRKSHQTHMQPGEKKASAG